MAAAFTLDLHSAAALPTFANKATSLSSEPPQVPLLLPFQLSFLRPGLEPRPLWQKQFPLPVGPASSEYFPYIQG